MTTRTMVPFTDFRASYEAEGEAWLAAVERVFRSGYYVLGQEVEKFEAEFAAWFEPGEQGPACVSVNSGTDALMLALMALELPAGSEVVLPTNTCPPTACAVVNAGLKPRFADVDPATLQLSAATLEAAIARGPGVRAVIPVHLYGHPAPMAELLAVAQREGLAVVEDCAQSTGALYQDRPTGLWGDIAAFSFYPTKNLGAIGDGGAVITRSAAHAEKMRKLRFYGQKDRAGALIPGGVNSRLDELQAAILRARLPLLNGNNARRRAIARRYDEALAANATAGVVPVAVPAGGTSVYHLYVVLTPAGARDAIQAELKDAGVTSLVHYPVPLHVQAGFAGYPAGALPTAEDTAGRVLSLPCYPEMTEDQLEAVCAALGALAPRG